MHSPAQWTIYYSYRVYFRGSDLNKSTSQSIFAAEIRLFQFGSACLCLLFLFICIPVPASAQHAISPEVWIEMRKMYRDKIPQSSIKEDITALSGNDARRAGPRLIDRGPEVLPAVHEALLLPNVEPRHAQRLLQIMRTIGDTSSVPVILKLLQDNPKTPLRRDALLALALLPATKDAQLFITDIAASSNEPWNTRRMAFTWFGLHRDTTGRPFAEEILTDPDLEKRTAGLYVLARLGDMSAIEPINSILTEGAPANSRDALMTSLAELVSPEEFIKRAPSSLSWSSGYKNSLLYARYLQADKSTKPAICREMLNSGLPGHLGIAVRCLLESGHANDLRPYAAISLEAPGREALIRNEIRKAGWHIIDTDEKFDIVP